MSPSPPSKGRNVPSSSIHQGSRGISHTDHQMTLSTSKTQNENFSRYYAANSNILRASDAELRYSSATIGCTSMLGELSDIKEVKIQYDLIRSSTVHFLLNAFL